MVSDQLLNTVYARAYGAAQQRLTQEAEMQRYNQERRDRTTLAANSALLQNMRFMEEAKRADRDYVFNIAKELGQYTGKGVQAGDTDLGRTAAVGANVGVADQQRKNAVFEAKRQQALEKLLAEHTLDTKRDEFKSGLNREEEAYSYNIRADDRKFEQDATTAGLGLEAERNEIGWQNAYANWMRARAAKAGKLGTNVHVNNPQGVKADQERAFNMQMESLNAQLAPYVQQYLATRGTGAALMDQQKGVDSSLLATLDIVKDPSHPGYSAARQYLDLLERAQTFAQSMEPAPLVEQPQSVPQTGARQTDVGGAAGSDEMDRRERLRRLMSGSGP